MLREAACLAHCTAPYTRGWCIRQNCDKALVCIWWTSLNGLVAQWIRHRPTEPGIAGSSPAEVNGIWIHPAPIKDSNSHYITVSQCMDTYRHALKNMRMPGVEPGAQACEACMLPLHYMRFCTKYDFDRFFAMQPC